MKGKWFNMKFVKGMVIGSILAAGALMMYKDTNNKKKMMKKGKQFIRKMGII